VPCHLVVVCCRRCRRPTHLAESSAWRDSRLVLDHQGGKEEKNKGDDGREASNSACEEVPSVLSQVDVVLADGDRAEDPGREEDEAEHIPACTQLVVIAWACRREVSVVLGARSAGQSCRHRTMFSGRRTSFIIEKELEWLVRIGTATTGMT
jgi:hypothetical protein